MVARFLAALSMWACGLRGHDDLLHFEPARISMKCHSCGYQSPGWSVEAAQRKAA